MAPQEKHIDSPFQVQPAVLNWVPAVANFVLAAGSLLFLAYVAMQLRNLSVAVSDKATATKLTAKIRKLEKQASTLEKQAGAGQEQVKEVTELKALMARYFETQKAKEEATTKLAGSEKTLERSLASLKNGVKGKKKKQVEAEAKRVKSEGERQLAALKEKSAKAAVENKKVYEQLKIRLKQTPAAASGAAKGNG